MMAGRLDKSTRGKAQRQFARGRPPVRRGKPNKVERAALRSARTADLRWRIPTGADGNPVPLTALRDIAAADLGRPPSEVGNGLLCAWLRHECSDYDRIIHRISRVAIARRKLRERVAADIAAAYPRLAGAADWFAAKMSPAQRAQLNRGRDRYSTKTFATDD